MPWKKLNKEQLKIKNDKRKIRRKENITKTREDAKVYAKKLRRQNPKWAMVSNMRYRAKEIGLEFNIKQEDIIIPEYCPVFGIKLTMLGDANYIRRNAPSIDRIDNSKGYIISNIRIISERANRIKSDATLEELKALVKYMEDNLG